MSAGVVAPVGNRPYRRLVIGRAAARWARWTAGRLPIRDTADCQSALQTEAVDGLRDTGELLVKGEDVEQ